jgi:5'(3')-deoxyribonucleotidase
MKEMVGDWCQKEFSRQMRSAEDIQKERQGMRRVECREKSKQTSKHVQVRFLILISLKHCNVGQSFTDIKHFLHEVLNFLPVHGLR